MQKSYLIVLCSNVGDAVCATPAIKLLRRCCPEAQIDVLTTSVPSAEVVRHNPDINQIIFDETVKNFVALGAKYTEILVFMATAKEMLVAKKFKRPYRLGDLPNPLHLRMVGLKLIQQLFPEEMSEAPTGNYLYPQTADFVSIETKLKQAGADLTAGEILIGCHVGCSKAAKRALQFWKRKISSHRTWPFENYAELMQSLQKDYPQIKWVMTGTLGERKILKKILKKRHNIVDLTAQTSVLELAALMKYCQVFLSGDTGPMHVASCTDVPMVSLFSSTRPEVTGPIPVRKNIILLREEESIANIKVEAVKRAILSLL